MVGLRAQVKVKERAEKVKLQIAREVIAKQSS
jgi:hypothetical protein